MKQVLKWLLVVLAVIVAFVLVEYIVLHYKMSGTKEVKIRAVNK